MTRLRSITVAAGPALALACLLVGASGAPAQGPQGRRWLQLIAAAESSAQLEVDQIRTVLTQGRKKSDPPRLVQSIEHLLVGQDSAPGKPRFVLTLVGMVGLQLTQSELDMRRRIFEENAPYLFLHSTFHVTDVERAEREYWVMYVGPTTRIGRPAHRIALLPHVLGRPVWVLDVDDQTNYPLYRAEYGVSGLLLSSVEVTSLKALADPQTVSWWRPSPLVTDYATVQEALLNLPAAAFVFPEAGTLPSGYELDTVRITRSDLNSEISLVTIYSDGIDQISVTQTLNALPLMADPTHYAIFAYQDLNTSQFLFDRKGVRHMIIGRTAQSELMAVAKRMLYLAVR